MEFEQEQIITSTVLSIIIILTFIWAFNSQEQIDINSFENCIEEDSCLYELIRVSNQTNLCHRAENSDTCFTASAIFFEDPHLCSNTNQEFECVVSLGIQSKENVCGYFEEETIFKECILNLQFFEIIE